MSIISLYIFQDILFDSSTHLVKKFVLHTNYPGHYNFNMWVSLLCCIALITAVGKVTLEGLQSGRIDWILIFISVFRNVWFQYHIALYLHTLLPLNPISDIIGVISRFLLSLKKVSLYQTLWTRSLFSVLSVGSFVFVSHSLNSVSDGTDAQSEDCILTTYSKVSL